MKQNIFLFVILILGSKGYSQNISKELDGITFSYFCHERDSLRKSKTLFVGQKDSTYTFEINNKIIKRLEISNPDLLSEFDKLLTLNLINKLDNCCHKYNCPDTLCYYFLMRKRGSKVDMIYLDIKFIDETICGGSELRRLIEILNSVDK